MDRLKQTLVVVLMLTILSLFFSLLGIEPAIGSQQTPHGSSKDHSVMSPQESAPHQEPAEEKGAHENTSSGHGHGHINLGEILPLWSCIPFAFMLLSIALFPLAAPEFWHHHFAKVAAFWALLLGVPFLIAYKGTALYEILHIIVAD